MEAYSSEVTPRGSGQTTGAKLKRGWSAQALAASAARSRRQSLGVTGMGMAAIGGNALAMPSFQAAPIRQRTDTGETQSTNTYRPRRQQREQRVVSPGRPGMAAMSSQAQPSADTEAILDMLDVIRQEVNDGISRLETRLERVERRVNPSMLGSS